MVVGGGGEKCLNGHIDAARFLVRVLAVTKVGLVNELSQATEPVVTQPPALDQRLERAVLAVVPEVGAQDVEGHALPRGVGCVREREFRIRIAEAPDEPGGGDAVDVRPGPRYPRAPARGQRRAMSPPCRTRSRLRGAQARGEVGAESVRLAELHEPPQRRLQLGKPPGVGGGEGLDTHDAVADPGDERALEGAGLPVRKACLLLIDNAYVRRGAVDPAMLFKEIDLTADVRGALPEIGALLADLKATLKRPEPPDLEIGRRCFEPYDCEFRAHCWAGVPEYSVYDLPRLRVDDLSWHNPDPFGCSLQNIRLEVRSGEILGIAGVAGNGQDELLALLSGETRLPRGERERVSIDTAPVANLHPDARRGLGLAFVPAERLGHGAVPEMSLVDNALLEPLSRACAQEQRDEFMLVVAPLVVVGGTGSPANPLAVF